MSFICCFCSTGLLVSRFEQHGCCSQFPTCLLDMTDNFVLLAGRNVMVWLLSSRSTHYRFWYAPSSFEALVRSMTSIFESWLDSKPSSFRMKAGVSEKTRLVLGITRFNVFGSLSIYLTYGGLFFAEGFILSSNNVSNDLDLSFFTTLCLFVLCLFLWCRSTVKFFHCLYGLLMDILRPLDTFL